MKAFVLWRAFPQSEAAARVELNRRQEETSCRCLHQLITAQDSSTRRSRSLTHLTSSMCWQADDTTSCCREAVATEVRAEVFGSVPSCTGSFVSCEAWTSTDSTLYLRRMPRLEMRHDSLTDQQVCQMPLMLAEWGLTQRTFTECWVNCLESCA